MPSPVRPEVFLVDHVKQCAAALDSVLIANGSTKGEADSCAGCLFDSYEQPYDFLVKGFDDFAAFNPAVPAFLAVGPPLMASLEHTSQLAQRLSGVTPVRVGFNEWEERALPKWTWFEKGPKLGALFITAVCSTMRSPDGRALRRCADCGRQQVDWDLVLPEIDEYSLDFDTWPGTDVFLIEGGGQDLGVCVTAEAVEGMRAASFTNMELRRLSWT